MTNNQLALSKFAEMVSSLMKRKFTKPEAELLQKFAESFLEATNKMIKRHKTDWD